MYFFTYKSLYFECYATMSMLACEQQTHFRSSLLSLLASEGEKRRPEMRLLFAGYVNVGRCLYFELGLPVTIVASHTEVSPVGRDEK